MSLAIRSVHRAATAGPIVPTAPPARAGSALPGAGQPARPAAPGETQLERLVKLVPADVVALYIPAVGLGSLTTWPRYPLAIAIGATLLVPLLLYLDARSAGDRVPALQYVVRTLAFVAWAFVISQPLAPCTIEPVIPALLALVLPVLGERLLRIPPRPW